MKHILLLFLSFFVCRPAFADLKIVASFPPIQSLVWSITENVYPVNVLIANPEQGHHDIQLKPSQMKTLKEADIVFWVDEDLESFMPQALQSIAPDALSVPLLKQTDNLKLVPSVLNKEKNDVHIWMNPSNAMQMLETITAVLSQKDVQNAEKFEENKQKVLSYLNKLKDEKKPSKNKKFLAFHDGFNYFNDFFDVSIQTLPIQDEKNMTPADFKQLKEYLLNEKPACSILDPSLSRKDRKKLLLKKEPVVYMDAFAWKYEFGPAHYYQMMKRILRDLRECGK